MALPSSGPISLADINVELGKASTAPISLNDADVRSLAGVPSGPITLPTDFHGKSLSISYTIPSIETGSFGFETVYGAGGIFNTTQLSTSVINPNVYEPYNVGIAKLHIVYISSFNGMEVTQLRLAVPASDTNLALHSGPLFFQLDDGSDPVPITKQKPSEQSDDVLQMMYINRGLGKRLHYTDWETNVGNPDGFTLSENPPAGFQTNRVNNVQHGSLDVYGYSTALSIGSVDTPTVELGGTTYTILEAHYDFSNTSLEKYIFKVERLVGTDPLPTATSFDTLFAQSTALETAQLSGFFTTPGEGNGTATWSWTKGIDFATGGIGFGTIGSFYDLIIKS